MPAKGIAGEIFPLALFVIACLAAGFFTAFLTDSFLVTAISGVVAGSVVRLAYDAVRRRRAGESSEEPSSGNGGSDDVSRHEGDVVRPRQGVSNRAKNGGASTMLAGCSRRFAVGVARSDDTGPDTESVFVWCRESALSGRSLSVA